MIRFSSLVATAVLGLAAATPGASVLSAAEPAKPALSAAGNVGALSLERMPSMLAIGWTARAEAAAQRQREQLVDLADRLAARDRASVEEFLASPRLYAPAPASNASADARLAEAVRAAAATDEAATPGLSAASSLPADFARSGYDLRPVAAAPASAASLYQEAGEGYMVRASAPNDYAAIAPARSSAWTESAAPVASASSHVSGPGAFAAPGAVSAGSYAAGHQPTLSGNALPAAPARPGVNPPVVSASPTITSVILIPINFASSDGNASTQTASFGITPSGGQTNQFLLTTINPLGSVPTGYGTAAADTNVTNLNTYFGLAAGTLAGRGAADGSGYLSQTMALPVGAVVSFDYVFLTDEDNTLTGSQFHNDQAFFTVNGAINSTLYQASQLSAAQLNNGSNTIFSFQTPGYVTVNYSVPATGNYTFGFGVIDVGVNTIKSGLLIDNFGVSAVPEPATWAGGALLLGAAVLSLRRRRALPR